MEEHERYMHLAIEQAEQAMNKGNHPFGALLVVDGQVVLTAQNTVITDKDVTQHAETALVSKACRTLEANILQRAVLYTSTEPCAMCSGAIYWARIPCVVYGCESAVLGQIAGDELAIPCKHVLSAGTVYKCEVIGPVLGDVAAEMHRKFWPVFNAKRK